MHGYLSGSAAEEPSDSCLSLVEKAEPDARQSKHGFLFNHCTLIF